MYRHRLGFGLCMVFVPACGLMLLAALLGGCAGTTSYTVVGPTQLAADEIDLGPGPTARLMLLGADEGEDVIISGVYVGDGYVITDAYAPFADAESVLVTFRVEGGLRAVSAADIVTQDTASGFALLKIPAGSPFTAAVLADMTMVEAGDDARLSVLDGLHRGTVVRPHFPSGEPGNLNDVMLLSGSFRGTFAGAGVYAENGTLLGMHIGYDQVETGTAIALPADRIARFLRANGVSYVQYDHRYHSPYPTRVSTKR